MKKTSTFRVILTKEQSRLRMPRAPLKAGIERAILDSFWDAWKTGCFGPVYTTDHYGFFLLVSGHLVRMHVKPAKTGKVRR